MVILCKAFNGDQQALQREEWAAQQKQGQKRHEYEQKCPHDEAEMTKIEHIQKLELLQAEAKAKSYGTFS